MLWDQLKEWKENCRWVELSHPLSPRAPHWSGFPDMADTTLFDYPDGFYVNKFELVSQYGTHVDAPAHFIEGAPTLESFAAEQLVMPLCVVDLCAKVRENQDYAASKQDILDWEAQYGPVPEGAFVALRTDWSKRGDLDNMDESGQKHYPGWSIECLEYLVKERKVGAIGHEPSDTDPAVLAAETGYGCEVYILKAGRFQVELLCNLDQVPPAGAVIFCGFPRAVGGAGFTARCIAVCSKD